MTGRDPKGNISLGINVVKGLILEPYPAAGTTAVSIPSILSSLIDIPTVFRIIGAEKCFP
jgi:hypothetical protein